MSAIWNGPKNGSRKPKQLLTTSSTSCGEARPSSTTSESVVEAGMTSTPGVHSGGLNQCIPQKRSGCSTDPASSSIGSDEVLETITASVGAASEQADNISCLRCRSSGTASKTSSALPTAPSVLSAVSTAFALSAASAASRPASACPRVRSTSCSFASRVSSCVASVRRTSMPAAAKHSATPRPIVPTPTMAALWGQPSYNPRSSNTPPIGSLFESFRAAVRPVKRRLISTPYALGQQPEQVSQRGQNAEDGEGQ